MLVYGFEACPDWMPRPAKPRTSRTKRQHRNMHRRMAALAALYGMNEERARHLRQARNG